MSVSKLRDEAASFQLQQLNPLVSSCFPGLQDQVRHGNHGWDQGAFSFQAPVRPHVYGFSSRCPKQMTADAPGSSQLSSPISSFNKPSNDKPASV